MAVTPQAPAERRGTTTGENEYNAPTNEWSKIIAELTTPY